MTKRIELNHIARVEGHGGLTVELRGTAATARFDVFEGVRLLEALLRGRHYADVPQIVSRICAICSVAHTLAAIEATERAFGSQPSPQTVLLRDLMLRGENIESHALHLFFLALPDYLAYPSAVAMAADRGDIVQCGLQLKQLGNLIQRTVGGREIHPVTAVVGGFASHPTTEQLVTLRDRLRDALAQCRGAASLLVSTPPIDLAPREISFAAMSPNGVYGYARGTMIAVTSVGRRSQVPVGSYRSLTNETTVPHSHAKHSTFDGRPLMVGALARVHLNGHRLDDEATDVMRQLNLPAPTATPFDNNKAQLVELVFDLGHALRIVEQLLQDGVDTTLPAAVSPRAGGGTAAVEAPRGLLFYSLTYDERGTVTAADIITPTAINAACIEEWVGHTAQRAAGLSTAELLSRCQAVVRAFDPCISCSVH